MFRRESASPLSRLEEKIREQHTDLIASKDLPRSARSAARCGAAEPIAIGIARHNQISPDFFASHDDCVEDRRILRISDVAGNIGKVAVGFGLRAEDLDL